jgi:hypothetical protein
MINIINKGFLLILLVILLQSISEAKSLKIKKDITWAKKIGNKKILYSDNTVREGGHRNWRNFNPGNLEYGKFAKSHGAIGTDGRFAIFPSMSKGYLAQAKLLSGEKYKRKSIKKAITKYAPSFENNTKKYISIISRKLGVHYSKKIKNLTSKQMNTMVKLMSEIEGMKKGKTYKYKRKS